MYDLHNFINLRYGTTFLLLLTLSTSGFDSQIFSLNPSHPVHF